MSLLLLSSIFSLPWKDDEWQKEAKKIRTKLSDDECQKKERENTKNKTTYSCSPSPMTANFSSNKGLSRSKTPPLPPAFAVGLNMYSSSSFSVALMRTFSRVPRFCCFCVDDDLWKETKLFVFEFLLIKPPPKEGMDALVFEEEEVEEEDEMRPATTTVEDDAASVNIFCSCCFKEVFCVTFSTIFYECYFCFFAALLMTSAQSRVCGSGSPFYFCVCCSFFLGAKLKNHLRRRTEEKAKRAHANLKRH